MYAGVGWLHAELLSIQKRHNSNSSSPPTNSTGRYIQAKLIRNYTEAMSSVVENDKHQRAVGVLSAGRSRRGYEVL